VTEPDELGPWSLVIVERIGYAALVEAMGPMPRWAAEHLYDRLDLGESLDRPFEFHRRAIADEHRLVVIGAEANRDLHLADRFNGTDLQARWCRARDELAACRAGEVRI
jgi:hypothetical protein